MPDKTELLLQELVTLHKEEAKRAQTHRWLRFIFGTLPAFVLVVLSIWGGYLTLIAFESFMENSPEFFEDRLSDFIPSLPTSSGSGLPR